MSGVDHPPGTTGSRPPQDIIRAGVLDRLDALLRTPVHLSEYEFDSLVDFVRTGLLDPDARPHRLRRLVPEKLPSGREGSRFQW